MVEEVIKKVVFGCNINSEIRAETRLGHLGYPGQSGYILSGSAGLTRFVKYPDLTRISVLNQHAVIMASSPDKIMN